MNARPMVQSEAQGGQVVVADDTSILAIISRVASDPNADPGKLNGILDLYERITDRNAKVAFTKDKLAMRPLLPSITARGRIIIPGKNGAQDQVTPFAKFEDIQKAVNPVLAAHGFDLSFRTGTAQDGKVTVTGILSHCEGHSEETTMSLPHDSSGSKNAVQAVGSSTSYGKRYVTCALLNLTIEGEDDDGKKGGDPPTITEEQAGEIQALIEDVKADKPKFLAYLKVGRIADIPASKFNDAIAALNKKRGA